MPRPIAEQVAVALSEILDPQDGPPFLAIKSLDEAATCFIPDPRGTDVILPPGATVRLPRHMVNDSNVKRLQRQGQISDAFETDELPEAALPEPDIPVEFATLSPQHVQAARQMALQPDSEPGQATMHFFDSITEQNILKKFTAKTNRVEGAFLKNHFCDVLLLAAWFDDHYHNFSKAQRAHVLERESTLRPLAAQYLPFL